MPFVIPHQRKIGKVRPENGVDLVLPGLRVPRVVEVADVKDGIGPFPLDQIEHVKGFGEEPLIPDERDLDRTDALRPDARSRIGHEQER